MAFHDFSNLIYNVFDWCSIDLISFLFFVYN